MFEISIIQRDMNGEPILDKNGNPKKRVFDAQKGDDLQSVWNKYSTSKKQRKPKKDNTPKVKAKVKAEPILDEDIPSTVERMPKRRTFDDEKDTKNERE